MTKPKVNVVGLNPRNNDVKRYYRLTSDHVFFELTGRKKNVTNDFTTFSRLGFSEIERDLLNISVSIFLADLSVSKNPFTSGREINLLIPVSDSDFWTNYESQISSICTFLDQNPFRVHFIENKEDVPDDIESPEIEADVVCCASGGLDSLAGAHNLLKEDYSVLLFTALHSPIIAQYANSTYYNLQKLHANVNHVVFNATPKKGKLAHQYQYRHENSMNCRSFLYLAGAAVVAHHFDIEPVVIPENGIFTLNIPFNRGRLSTRTTHPVYIRDMQKLLHDVLPNRISISNPFKKLTKAEVIEQLRYIPNTIIESVSCAHATNARRIAGALSKTKSLHCGVCYPCIARRLSLIQTKLEKYDTNYVIDIFNDLFPVASKRKEYRDASVTILGLLKFIYDINNFKDFEIRSKYPEFENLPTDYPVDDAVALYQRYAEEVRDVFSKNSSNPMKQIIEDFLS